MVAVVINFVILIYILNYFLYKPVLNMLQERRTYVERTLAEADIKMASAKASAEEGLQVINKANAAAKQIVDDARSASGKIREEAREAAKEEADEMKMRAREEIVQFKAAARKQMVDDTAVLSVKIAEKIIKKKMNQKLQRSLIDDFIEKVRN